MKNILTLCLFLILKMNCFAQSNNYNSEDYQWLHDLESAENLKWVEARKAEALNYFNTFEILPQLEEWKKNYTGKKKWNYLAQVPPDAYQVGEFAEALMGSTWARMPYSNLLLGMPPSTIDISEVTLSSEGDMLFDEVISRAPDYSECLVFYKRKGERNLRSLTEYNLKDKRIVENGFQLPRAQTGMQWRDENSVYVCTNLINNYEHGNKLRVWQRGQAIEDARVLFESNLKKVRVKLFERSGHLFVIEQKQAFDENYFYLKDDELTPLDLPKDVTDMKFVSGQFVVHLRSGWKPENTYFPAGSLISIKFDAFLKGDMNFNLISASSREQVIDKIWNTNEILISRVLENVQSVLFEWTYSDGQWKSRRIENPMGNNINIITTQDQANRYYIEYRSFFERARFVRQPEGNIVKYLEYNEAVNQEDYTIKQWFATSKDGTKVPYFIVHKKDLNMNSKCPVIMNGYGGWGNSRLPTPLRQYIKWLDDGGVYVLANIRGGGEYGPDWHEAARKSNRQTSYDDFKAIAEDLIKKQVTQAGLIGSYGASNGGLLVANGFIQNPELFGAVVIWSGSLDLKGGGTGNGKGIGATGERGDPEIPEDWAYMKKISPIHNLTSNKKYPPILLMTSRNDDISHCAKSRKFYQRMKDLGYNDIHLIETERGGHGYTDLANQFELELAFFYKKLHPDYEELVSR